MSKCNVNFSLYFTFTFTPLTLESYGELSDKYQQQISSIFRDLPSSVLVR